VQYCIVYELISLQINVIHTAIKGCQNRMLFNETITHFWLTYILCDFFPIHLLYWGLELHRKHSKSNLHIKSVFNTTLPLHVSPTWQLPLPLHQLVASQSWTPESWRVNVMGQYPSRVHSLFHPFNVTVVVQGWFSYFLGYCITALLSFFAFHSE